MSTAIETELPLLRQSENFVRMTREYMKLKKVQVNMTGLH